MSSRATWRRGALSAMGDKVSRIVRPLANGDKWFAS
jgi:hypothetical protein